MSRQRKETVKYRNIRLNLETYNLLDKYLLELMQKKQDTRITLDDAVKSLIEKNYLLEKGREV
jgi:hypothetical protein